MRKFTVIDTKVIEYDFQSCNNCGREVGVVKGSGSPDSCKHCKMADFVTYCPVCNSSRTEKISENTWNTMNWEEQYHSAMVYCRKCGAWYNPMTKCSIGDFEKAIKSD